MNINRINIFILGLTFAAAIPAYGAGPEIFIAGKKFSSVEDYKLERLRKAIRATYKPDELQDINQLIGKFLEEFSLDQLNRMPDDELMKILAVGKNEESVHGKFIELKDQDLADMRKMLDQLKEEPGKPDLPAIDPQKIKSIEIAPKQ